jgi:hypothetical protein
MWGGSVSWAPAGTTNGARDRRRVGLAAAGADPLADSRRLTGRGDGDGATASSRNASSATESSTNLSDGVGTRPGEGAGGSGRLPVRARLPVALVPAGAAGAGEASIQRRPGWRTGPGGEGWAERTGGGPVSAAGASGGLLWPLMRRGANGGRLSCSSDGLIRRPRVSADVSISGEGMAVRFPEFKTALPRTRAGG